MNKTWKKWVLFPLILLALSGGLLLARQAYRSVLILREVVVVDGGTKHLSEEAIIKLSGVRLGQSLIRLRLSRLEENLHRFGWVKEVSLIKRYPNRLYIKVTEHKPIAMIYMEDWFYVNRDGKIFKKIAPTDSRDYPIITGLTREQIETKWEMLESLVGFLKSYKKNPVSAHHSLSEINWDPVQGLVVYTYQPTFSVIFGHESYREKLVQWEKIAGALKKRGIQPRTVDLTYGEKVYVKTNSARTELVPVPQRLVQPDSMEYGHLCRINSALKSAPINERGKFHA
ncbi:MAG: FtsQ-type POTRA domain-containing protein [bacterium]|nr:FtsQ-type POTRA domain-containing protein [bacterium]